MPFAKLARLSTTTFTATPVGMITGWPELTGNGNAELWGWFPSDSMGSTTPRVEKIDKTTGAALTTYMLPELKGAPMAWAFAFWGVGLYWWAGVLYGWQTYKLLSTTEPRRASVPEAP